MNIPSLHWCSCHESGIPPYPKDSSERTTPRYNLKSDSNSRELNVCRLFPLLSATKHRKRIQFRSSELQVSPGPVLGGRFNSSAKFLAIHSDNFWGRDWSRGWLPEKHIQMSVPAYLQHLKQWTPAASAASHPDLEHHWYPDKRIWIRYEPIYSSNIYNLFYIYAQYTYGLYQGY